MELHMTTFLIVCPLVFLAGFVDAIGGGGGAHPSCDRNQ